MTKRLLALSILALSSPALAATTFLHHFDGTPGSGAGDADFAAGNPAQLIPPPFGNGGQIVSSPARFGNSLLRTNGVDIGGRVQYATAGNYNVNVGTIEMWINQPDITAGGFVGLWGTVTGSGSGSGSTDVRMYIYDTGAGRTFGAYQLGGGGSFWEIEQPIPEALLTSNTWHHVAWAFDTNAGITATWWDGQLLRNTPDAGTVNPRTTFNNTRFHVGENQNGSAPFPGYIDELRISDTVVYDTTRNLTVPTAPFTVGPTFVRGDFGGNESSDTSFNTPDGAFDALDIEGFLLALNNPASYLALNPTLGSSLTARGDFGGNESTDGSFNTPDGEFSGLDIEGFLLAINDPAGYNAIQPPSFGGVNAIPEPAAIGLLFPLVLSLGTRHRR